MSIQVESTTDSKEAVTAAIGDLAKDKVETEDSAAATESQAETTEESEASEVEEAEAGDGEGESENEDESSSKDEKKAKKQGGFKKRIAKLNSKISEKDRQIDYWRNEAQKAPASGAAEKVATQAEVKSEGKPKSDDYSTHDEYIEALTDWKVDQKAKAGEAEKSKTQAQTEFQKQLQSHGEKAKSFKESHDDFDELMADVDAEGIRLSITVRDAILSSENGPELQYELAKNKAELKRICALPAIAAAREIGRFEAKFAKADSSKAIEPKTTKAPKPITPVGSKTASAGKKDISDPNLTQAEYEAIRREQMRKRA